MSKQSRTIYIVHSDYVFSKEQKDNVIIYYSEYAEKEPDYKYEFDANNKGLRDRQIDTSDYIKYVAGEAIASDRDVYFVVDYAHEWNKYRDLGDRLCVQAYEDGDDEYVDDCNGDCDIPRNINRDVNDLHVLLKKHKKTIKISKELY